VEAEARAWLSGVFGGEEVPFALPPDFVWWIEEVAAVGWSDNPDDPYNDTHSTHARPDRGPMDMLAFIEHFIPEGVEH
jgi:hypothetical protein